MVTNNCLCHAGVLSALAAGTLVYVAMFEIIQREKSKEKVPGLAQLLFILMGFGVILLFTRYGEFTLDAKVSPTHFKKQILILQDPMSRQ